MSAEMLRAAMMIALPDMLKHKKHMWDLLLEPGPKQLMVCEPPIWSDDLSAKTAISQSKRSEEISLLQPALTFNNEPWFEKIGTARQFALVLPNVVRNMEHISETLAGQIAT
jgi:hypothetical protein